MCHDKLRWFLNKDILWFKKIHNLFFNFKCFKRLLDIFSFSNNNFSDCVSMCYFYISNIAFSDKVPYKTLKGPGSQYSFPVIFFTSSPTLMSKGIKDLFLFRKSWGNMALQREVLWALRVTGLRRWWPQGDIWKSSTSCALVKLYVIYICKFCCDCLHCIITSQLWNTSLLKPTC